MPLHTVSQFHPQTRISLVRKLKDVVFIQRTFFAAYVPKRTQLATMSKRMTEPTRRRTAVPVPELHVTLKLCCVLSYGLSGRRPPKSVRIPAHTSRVHIWVILLSYRDIAAQHCPNYAPRCLRCATQLLWCYFSSSRERCSL